MLLHPRRSLFAPDQPERLAYSPMGKYRPWESGKAGNISTVSSVRRSRRPDALQAHVVARIRELAKRKRISLNKLADFAGVSRSHLARLLVQARSPTLLTLWRIAAALDANVRDLLPTRDPEPPPAE